MKLKRTIEPVPIPTDDKPYPLSDVFDHPYRALFISAVPGPGKTTLIHNLIRMIASDLKGRTGQKPGDMFPLEVVVFCGTIEQDAMWKQIFDLLDSFKIPHREYEDIYAEEEDARGKLVKIPLLRAELAKVKADKIAYEAREEAKKKPKKSEPVVVETPLKKSDPIPITECYCYSAPRVASEASKRAKKEDEFIMTQKLFIFDDISTALDNESLIKFVKEARHSFTRVIVSTQDFLDIPQDFKNCMNYFINFSGLNRDRLLKIYRTLAITMDQEDFIKLYEQITPGRHDFMFYTKTKPREYRIGLSDIHELPSGGSERGTLSRATELSAEGRERRTIERRRALEEKKSA